MTALRIPRLVIPDGRLAASYDVAGPRGAAPLVLVHGVVVSRAMWSPQVAALSDAFRVIALDLPGHGVLADLPFRFDDAVDGIARVVDREAGGRAVLVGLSLGGYVAMEFAFRHPGRAAALVLAGCTREPQGPAVRVHAAAFAASRLAEDWANTLTEGYFRLRYPASVADPIVGAGFSTRGGTDATEELLRRAYLARLPSYPGPILFLNGEQDVMFRGDEAAFAAAARAARLEVIPRAGHLVNLDRPEAFTAAVRAFLRGLAR